jgi:hypothetical protein
MIRIKECMKKYGFKSFEAINEFCLARNIDFKKIFKDIQPMAFEDAIWAWYIH